jgi:hypothetical protein
MDRDYPDTASELRDTERWPYEDLQKLAAENDHGRIVGVAREELIEYCVETLGFDSDTADGNQSETVPDPDSTEEDSDEESDPEPKQTERQEQKTDGGTQTVPTTDEISVGHEGEEKLSPEHAPDDDGTAVESPEGVNLDGIGPDDLEPDNQPAPEPPTDESKSQSESSQRQAETDEDDSGGLLSRIKGDSKKSSEDIVEEADNPEERQRREEVRDQLAGAMGGEQSTGDPASAESTKQASGMVVDETVVGHLIEMPFNTASAATGWDGWELTQRERQANAELFIAMCDERGIDVSETTMFALSMAGTFGGRMARYRRHKSGQTESAPDEPEEEIYLTDPTEGDSGPATSSSSGGSGNQSQNSQQEEIDFADSSTW